ncbi:MAG: hypothetical protein FJX56_01785 [Alphaproteobacteria bacterium]|nr:hypothetical protein [Alphaproteobacteria bacterium]
MGYRGRVLLYDTDPEKPLRLASAFDDRAYWRLSRSTFKEALTAAAAQCPDVVILNDGAEREGTADAVRELELAAGVPVILISDRPSVRQRALHSAGALTHVLPSSFNDNQLFARVGSLVRLNTMRKELARRAETAADYGQYDATSVEPSATVTEARVVALCPDEGDRAVIAQALGERYAITFSCSAAETVDLLLSGGFDALLIALDHQATRELEVCHDVRRNSRLYHVRIVLVADPAALSNGLAPFIDAVDDVVPRPAAAAEFISRLDAVVLQHRYREAMH